MAFDVVFISMENWDDVWRRNQFVCARLATHFPDAKILFVGVPRDFCSGLLQRRLPDLFSPAMQKIRSHPNITFMRYLKLLPNSLTWCSKINEAHARHQILSVASGLGIDRPILWLNPHSSVHMAGKMGERSVVYDITDDWIEAAENPAQRRQIENQDARLCELADAVIVCSESLYARRKVMARKIYLVPNGVDLQHYEGIANGSVARHPDTLQWQSPVLGYTGTLHAERIDLELIGQLAVAFPQGAIALVGPQHLSDSDMARLRSFDNIKLTGAVPYSDIPGYMAAFDVCITPHKVSSFTESLNPIKLWEYLACGKPIVSTAVAGFRDYPELVRVAANSDEFIAACQSALSEDAAMVGRRQAVASQNTWEARMESIVGILEGLA